MLIGMRLPAISAPLRQHRRGPVLYRAKMFRQLGVCQHSLHAPTHVYLGCEVGVVGNAETEYLAHERSSFKIGLHAMLRISRNVTGRFARA